MWPDQCGGGAAGAGRQVGGGCYQQPVPTSRVNHRSAIVGSKNNPNFRYITGNVKEKEILHEIFRYISCYIWDSGGTHSNALLTENKKYALKVIVSRDCLA